MRRRARECSSKKAYGRWLTTARVRAKRERTYQNDLCAAGPLKPLLQSCAVEGRLSVRERAQEVQRSLVSLQGGEDLVRGRWSLWGDGDPGRHEGSIVH